MTVMNVNRGADKEIGGCLGGGGQRVYESVIIFKLN